MKCAKNLFVIFKRYINSRKFFYRILIPFSVLCIVIICLTVWMVFGIIGKKYEEQIKETNVQMLKQVQIYGEQNLYSDLMQIINYNFFQGVGAKPLSNFFFGGDSLTVYDYYTYYQEIVDICSKHDYIKAITLYRYSPSTMVDSRYGVSFDSSAQLDTINRTVPLTFYNSKVNEAKKLRFLPAEECNATSRPGLTLICPIPFYQNFDTANEGYVSINIDQDRFASDINEIYQFKDSLMILDSNNRVLFENMPSKIKDISPADFAKLLEESEKQGDDEKIKYQNVTYNISRLKSIHSGWTYISIVPTETLNAEFMAVGRLVLSIAVGIIFVVIILIHIITANVYKPLKRLRVSAPSQGADDPEKDDISSIRDALDFLTAQRDDMSHTIEQNVDLVKYKALMGILYNKGIPEDDLRGRLELCGIHFELPYYCVMSVEIEEKAFYMLTMEQREYITLQLQKFAADWLVTQLVQITEAHPENRIVTVINVNTALYESLSSRLDELLSFIAANLHLRVNISLSRPVDTLRKLNDAYATIIGYLKYSFIYDYGNAFTAQSCELFEENHFEASAKGYSEIQTMLRAGKTEQAAEWLKDCENKILNGSYSYKSVNDFLLQVYNLLFKIVKELGIFDDAKTKELAVKKLGGSSGFYSSMESIYSILKLYGEAYLEKTSGGDNQLIARVVNYIEENCFNEIQLTSIADNFKVSASHLSRLFKSVMGENLSVYIINCKLETAAKMLLEMPQKSIADISVALGYFTPTYFTKLFKEKYGMTPSEYRKRFAV